MNCVRVLCICGDFLLFNFILRLQKSTRIKNGPLIVAAADEKLLCLRNWFIGLAQSALSAKWCASRGDTVRYNVKNAIFIKVCDP